ncbi:MAG: hypothetical protein IKE75_03010 [Bacilli bacterium]|nr:hypothetical protein [Bacilli bacterium]
MNYLIPANSKKSLLIFGFFTQFDLILFGTGLAITLILLLVISPSTLLGAFIDLAPAVITGFLVLPVPHYHNTMTVIKDVYKFYTSRQKFIWKGWCVADGIKNTSENGTQK